MTTGMWFSLFSDHRASPATRDSLIRFVLQIVADHIGKASGDGPADFFAHMRQTSERAPENSEALGHLPVNAHIERDCRDRAGDIHRQMLANLLVGNLTDFLEQLAVTAVDFGFLRNLK